MKNLFKTEGRVDVIKLTLLGFGLLVLTLGLVEPFTHRHDNHPGHEHAETRPHSH